VVVSEDVLAGQPMNETKWESYEEVAAYLLDQMASAFGLQRVEAKQKVKGLRSGAEYEIDAKGVLEGKEAFVIIECRRYTSSKQKQEQIGALAYRILDTRAAGGVVVSPLGLQEGAAKIAKAENIVNVQLGADSTRKDYMLRFLNQVFVCQSDTVRVTERVSVVKINEVGDITEIIES
jgi:hypothetical protein